jgi:hypothetical protein
LAQSGDCEQPINQQQASAQEAPSQWIAYNKFNGVRRGRLVGRSYAGVLGPVAFVTMIARGLLGGGGSQTTLLHAWIALLSFAMLGYVIGRLAGLIVQESVQGKVAAELAAHDAQPQAASGP